MFIVLLQLMFVIISVLKLEISGSDNHGIVGELVVVRVFKLFSDGKCTTRCPLRLSYVFLQLSIVFENVA